MTGTGFGSTVSLASSVRVMGKCRQVFYGGATGNLDFEPERKEPQSGSVRFIHMSPVPMGSNEKISGNSYFIFKNTCLLMLSTEKS